MPKVLDVVMAHPQGAAVLLANSASVLGGEHGLSRWSAAGICGALALMYVLILYLPLVILNLSPSRSVQEHLLRRFAFAFLASVASPVICALVLPLQGRWKSDLAMAVRIFGVRFDHLAVLFPLLLTIILYLGPIVMAVFALYSEMPQEKWSGTSDLLERVWWYLVKELRSAVNDITSWRNYVVAPLSEELVFRACMVPVLLCGGFSTSAITFLCPLFFSFAHLHHFGELVFQQQFSMQDAALISAAQLLYTTIFGWYATFLYLRTGHLVASSVVHIFCNYMGAPDLAGGLCSGNKTVPLCFVIGLVCFSLLLWPATTPMMYNDTLEDCQCWLGFCRYSPSAL